MISRANRQLLVVTGRSAVAGAVLTLLIVGCGSADHHLSQPSRPAGSATATAATASSTAGTTASAANAAQAELAAGTPVNVAGFHTGRWSPTGPRQTMAGVVQFQTPSGNIACTAATADELKCSIAERDFQGPPRPADCGLNWLSGLVSLDTEIHVGDCAGNPETTLDSTVLAYGHTLRFGDFGCYSGAAALTCLQTTSEHGFSLSRTALTSF
jgi:hypothetical protein